MQAANHAVVLLLLLLRICLPVAHCWVLWQPLPQHVLPHLQSVAAAGDALCQHTADVTATLDCSLACVVAAGDAAAAVPAHAAGAAAGRLSNHAASPAGDAASMDPVPQCMLASVSAAVLRRCGLASAAAAAHTVEPQSGCQLARCSSNLVSRFGREPSLLLDPAGTTCLGQIAVLGSRWPAAAAADWDPTTVRAVAEGRPAAAAAAAGTVAAGLEHSC